GSAVARPERYASTGAARLDDSRLIARRPRRSNRRPSAPLPPPRKHGSRAFPRLMCGRATPRLPPHHVRGWLWVPACAGMTSEGLVVHAIALATAPERLQSTYRTVRFPRLFSTRDLARASDHAAVAANNSHADDRGYPPHVRPRSASGLTDRLIL